MTRRLKPIAATVGGVNIMVTPQARKRTSRRARSGGRRRVRGRDRGGRDAVRGGCSVRAAVADYPVRRRGCGGRAAVQKIMEE